MQNFTNKLFYFKFKGKTNTVILNKNCLKIIFLLLRKIKLGDDYCEFSFHEFKKSLRINKNNNYGNFDKNIKKLSNVYIYFWYNNEEIKFLKRRPIKFKHNYKLNFSGDLIRKFIPLDPIINKIAENLKLLNNYFSITFFSFFCINLYSNNINSNYWNFHFKLKKFRKKFSLENKYLIFNNFHINVVSKIICEINMIKLHNNILYIVSSNNYDYLKSPCIYSFNFPY